MKQSVVIKANNYGIIVVLDPTPDFNTLKQLVAEKFRDSAKFLGEARMALSFEGRELSEEEERELLDIIQTSSNLHVVCLLDKDPEKEERFRKSLSQRLMELEAKTGQFYKGNLRSGQVLEFETSVIILGDVNPGAKIVSKGNIIVLGALKGIAAAGAAGNEGAFVLALNMRPVQIRIGDILARSSDDPSPKGSKEPQIAYVYEGNIYIETLDKGTLENIRF